MKSLSIILLLSFSFSTFSMDLNLALKCEEKISTTGIGHTIVEDYYKKRGYDSKSVEKIIETLSIGNLVSFNVSSFYGNSFIYNNWDESLRNLMLISIKNADNCRELEQTMISLWLTIQNLNGENQEGESSLVIQDAPKMVEAMFVHADGKIHRGVIRADQFDGDRAEKIVDENATGDKLVKIINLEHSSTKE